MDSTKPLLRRFFSIRPEIQFAYLFGSLTSGRTNPMSDIDIAIHIDPTSESFRDDPFHFELSLKADLVAALRTDRADLILLNHAPITLAHQVLRRGILIFSRSETARVNHFVSVSSLFPDIRRMLEVHYRNTLRRIDAGEFGRPARG